MSNIALQSGVQPRRYLRIYLGGEHGEPGISLYEIDAAGWVHRQVQIQPDATRFAPEDVLICRPVRMSAIVRHPFAEEIDAEAFEHLWSEVAPTRTFLATIPDPARAWMGRVEAQGSSYTLHWLPDANAPWGYARVPGFDALFVLGSDKTARQVAAAVFLGAAVAWDAPIASVLVRFEDAPVAQTML